MSVTAGDEDWYCFECHNLGGWEEDGEETGWGPSEWVDCPCCGYWSHSADGPAPKCHPSYKEGA